MPWYDRLLAVACGIVCGGLLALIGGIVLFNVGVVDSLCMGRVTGLGIGIGGVTSLILPKLWLGVGRIVFTIFQ